MGGSRGPGGFEVVPAVQQLGAEMAGCTDAELRQLSDTLRTRATDGESLEALLPTAFALVREAAARTSGERLVEQQLVAGAALHAGAIVDMKDGEGPWLAVTLAAHLNALAGAGVHLVTHTEYSAHRAAGSVGPILGFLGLEVVTIVKAQRKRSERKASYAADIVVGTHEEFLIDHLFDARALSPESQAQRGHPYAIVAEADHVLIDEALQAERILLRGDKTVITARIAPRSYFGLYDKLAGISATAASEAAELRLAHGVDVVEIPTERPCVRVDHPDTTHTSLLAVLADLEDWVRTRHETGRPILVGTAKSRTAGHISKRLDAAGLPHTVIDTTGDDADLEEAARVLAEAGRPGAVTILAGDARGMDVPLAETAAELGGLLVIGADRNEWSRRWDTRLTQLAGRRGEPGESKFIFRSIKSAWHRGRLDSRIRRWKQRLATRRKPTPTERNAAAQFDAQIHYLHRRTRPLSRFVAVVDAQGEIVTAERTRVLRMPADELGRETARRIQEVLGDEGLQAYEERRADVGVDDWPELEREIIMQILEARWCERLADLEDVTMRLRGSLFRMGALRRRWAVRRARRDATKRFAELQAGLEGAIVRDLLDTSD